MRVVSTMPTTGEQGTGEGKGREGAEELYVAIKCGTKREKKHCREEGLTKRSLVGIMGQFLHKKVQLLYICVSCCLRGCARFVCRQDESLYYVGRLCSSKTQTKTL